MDVTKLPISFADKRGEIIDVLQREPIEYATIIHSRKGAVRANHYHKETWQWLYVLAGKLRGVSQMPDQAPTRRSWGRTISSSAYPTSGTPLRRSKTQRFWC